MMGELLECLDIVPGISQMPQGTSRPRSRHLSQVSGKLQLYTSRSDLAPAVDPNSSLSQDVKTIELVSFYPGI